MCISPITLRALRCEHLRGRFREEEASPPSCATALIQPAPYQLGTNGGLWDGCAQRVDVFSNSSSTSVGASRRSPNRIAGCKAALALSVSVAALTLAQAASAQETQLPGINVQGAQAKKSSAAKSKPKPKPVQATHRNLLRLLRPAKAWEYRSLTLPLIPPCWHQRYHWRGTHDIWWFRS